jgi:hypothetical protein
VRIDVSNTTWLVLFSALSVAWLGVAVLWLISTSGSLRRMADAMESFVRLQIIEDELHDELEADDEVEPDKKPVAPAG